MISKIEHKEIWTIREKNGLHQNLNFFSSKNTTQKWKVTDWEKYLQNIRPINNLEYIKNTNNNKKRITQWMAGGWNFNRLH